MAITHIGTVVDSSNATTTFPLTIPAATEANDVLILSVTNRDAATDPTVTDNDTGGNTWAKVGGGATGLTVWWKRATSATAGKVVTAAALTGSSAGVLSVYRGVSLTTTPYENVTTESNISGNETHAAITPTVNGAWVFLCIANRTDDIATATQAATSPAVLTERGESLSTGGSDCSNTLCSAEQSTAGTTGAITWAQTDAASISCVFNLIPATAERRGVDITNSGTADVLLTDIPGLDDIMAGHTIGLISASAFYLAFDDAAVTIDTSNDVFIPASVPVLVTVTGAHLGLRAVTSATANVRIWAAEPTWRNNR